MASHEITSTMESYLEAVFELEEVGERITQARLARWFGVSPPATSEIVHRLAKHELLSFDDDRTIVLTEEGRNLAAEMAGRHRLIERYLVDILQVPWHLADEEVRKLEPGISDIVLERIRASLAGVERCPHGNPIPGTETARMKFDLKPLDECAIGELLRVDRIREDLELDLDMLRYLEDHKLFPGTELTVSDRDPEGAVTVSRDGKSVAVGPVLASHILCVSAA